MKFLKSFFIASATLLGISATLFSSCSSKDSCDTLVCQNGGTCAGGFCNCPTGFDGPQCENRITDRYIGKYAGWIPATGGQPAKADTVEVFVSAVPYTMSFFRHRDPGTVYTGTLEYKNNTIVVADIVNGIKTTQINFTIRKASPQVDTTNICNLNLIEYTNGVKTSTIYFDGVQYK